MLKNIAADIFGSIKDHCIIALVFVILSAVVLVDQAGNRTQGIFPIMGNILQLQAADNIPEDNKETVKEIVQLPAPEIVWNGQSDITVGNTVHLFDYFVVNTSEAVAIPAVDYELLQVKEITDESDNSILQQFDEIQKSIIFPHSGIYTITFYIRDNQQKETVAKIDIPVNPE